MNEHFNVIIIGAGADGRTLLHRLAASGKRILVLERSPFLPRENAQGHRPIELLPVIRRLQVGILILLRRNFRHADKHRRRCQSFVHSTASRKTPSLTKDPDLPEGSYDDQTAG